MDSLLRRAFQQISLVVKPGTVTGTVPSCPFVRIPYKLASQMRADDVYLKYPIFF